MRVVPLFRVSTEKQENEGASLPAQERLYGELAAARGWQTVEPFRGQESAAAAAAERAVLQRVIACLRAQSVDAVWVIEQSRLTRADQLESAMLLREMVERKVGLIVGRGELQDLSSIDGEMVYGIRAAVDRGEHRRIRERMQRGRREKARQGKKTGGKSAYGYRNPPAGDPLRGKLQPFETEAAVVRRIFAEVAAGVGVRELARRLTAESVPAPRSGAWGTSTLGRVLRNPTYLGTQLCGAWRAEEGSTTFRLDLHHPEAIVVEGAHAALVTAEEWEAAHAQLGGNSNGKPALLTGLLSINGRRVHVDAARGSSYYKPADGKPGPWVPVAPLQELVWRGFQGLFSDADSVRRIFTRASRGDFEAAIAGELETLEQRRRKLAARLERLVEMRTDGEISRRVFLERQESTLRAQRELEAAIASARRRRDAAAGGQVERGLAAVRALLCERVLGEAARRTLLRHLLDSVHVTVVERAAPQPKAKDGRWLKPAAPRWRVDDVFLRLRPHPGASTTDFGCSQLRAPLLVQVVRGGELVAAPELAAPAAAAVAR